MVEIWPGGGWYTEILAPTLNGAGKLYVAEYGPNAKFPYQRAEMDALQAKITAAPTVFGDVTHSVLAFPVEAPIAPPGSADLVVTFRNVHNWFDPNYGADAKAAFAAAASRLERHAFSFSI